MPRLVGVVTAIVVLGAFAVSAHAGGGPLSGRIVFSAVDAPAAHDLMYVSVTGTTRDLAHVGVADAFPIISPDGKLVAFTRDDAEWVVGTSGKGLHRITPSLGGLPQVAWAPDSRTLAVTDGSAIYRASAHGGVWSRLVGGATGLVGWSPDGSRLAYSTTLAGIDFVTAAGRHLAVDLNGSTGFWSPAGRLAVPRTSTAWDVYEETGKRLATYTAVQAAWSPTGALATVDGSGVVRIRPRGVGRPTVTARPIRGAASVAWAGPTHLLVDGPGGPLLFDVAHRKTFVAPSGYDFGPVITADGSAYAYGQTFGTLIHVTLSGATRTVAAASGACGGKDTNPFDYLRVVPDGSGAVYESTCEPPHDLFAVAPDGTGLTRLTHTPQDELDPAVSPDGTELAFTRQDTGGCVGCNHQIWITASDGSAARAVTLPADGSQDDNPSFSPDGSRIVFSRWEPSVTGDTARIAEAAATGGAATLLRVSGGYPAWGPSRIAFEGAAVDTIAPDGSGAAAVPNTKLSNSGIPAWSWDGRLAVLRVSDTLSIYLPATGATIRLPGLHPAVTGAPGLAWSPDGTRLAFTGADASGLGDVWMVNADGTGLTRLTHGLGADGALAWR